MSPTVLRAGEFEFFFYSHEAREPPHVHVKKGGAVAKVWLEDSPELAEIHGFNPNERRRLLSIVRTHRTELLERWHDYFDEDTTGDRR